MKTSNKPPAPSPTTKVLQKLQTHPLIPPAWRPQNLTPWTASGALEDLPQRFFTLNLWTDQDDSALTLVFSEGWLASQSWDRSDLEALAQDFKAAGAPGVLILPGNREDRPGFEAQRWGQRPWKWTTPLGTFPAWVQPRFLKFKPSPQPSLVIQNPRDHAPVQVLLAETLKIQDHTLEFQPQRLLAGETRTPGGLEGSALEGRLGFQIWDPRGQIPGPSTSRLLAVWLHQQTQRPGFPWKTGPLLKTPFKGSRALTLEGLVLTGALSFTLHLHLDPQLLETWLSTFPGIRPREAGPLETWLALKTALPAPSPPPVEKSPLTEILSRLPGSDRRIFLNQILSQSPLPGPYLAQALFWQEELTVEGKTLRKRRWEAPLPLAALAQLLPRHSALSLRPRPSQLGTPADYLEAQTLVLRNLDTGTLALLSPRGRALIAKLWTLPQTQKLLETLKTLQDFTLLDRTLALPQARGEQLLARFTDRELGILLRFWPSDRWKRLVSRSRQHRIQEEFQILAREDEAHQENLPHRIQTWKELQTFLTQAESSRNFP